MSTLVCLLYDFNLFLFNFVIDVQNTTIDWIHMSFLRLVMSNNVKKVNKLHILPTIKISVCRFCGQLLWFPFFSCKQSVQSIFLVYCKFTIGLVYLVQLIYSGAKIPSRIFVSFEEKKNPLKIDNFFSNIFIPFLLNTLIFINQNCNNPSIRLNFVYTRIYFIE